MCVQADMQVGYMQLKKPWNPQPPAAGAEAAAAAEAVAAAGALLHRSMIARSTASRCRPCSPTKVYVSSAGTRPGLPALRVGAISCVRHRAATGRQRGIGTEQPKRQQIDTPNRRRRSHTVFDPLALKPA